MIAGIEPNVIWNARLTNLTGQVVREFNGLGANQVALTGITPGMYLLQLNDDNATAKSIRIIIE